MNETPFVVDVQFPRLIDTQPPPRCHWFADHNGELFDAVYRSTRLDWWVEESFRFPTIEDARAFVAETHRRFESLKTTWQELTFATRIWMFKEASEGTIGITRLEEAQV